MRRQSPALLLSLALFSPLPALADCADPQTQAEMESCAAQSLAAADGDLNQGYKLAIAAMKDWDAGLPKAQRGAEEALRQAQRAWLPYRDAVCANETFFYRGGSIEELVRLSCLDRVTRARTEELRAMAEGE